MFFLDLKKMMKIFLI